MEHIVQRRQVIYWRLLTVILGYLEQGENFDTMTADVTDELDMPSLILNPNMSIDDLLRRYPDLEEDFDLKLDQDMPPEYTLRRALIVSKLLMNVFGPNTQQPNISAAQYAQWLQDVGHLERCLGFQPGSLRGGAPQVGEGQPGQGQGQPGENGQGGGMPHGPAGAGAERGGSGFNFSEEELREVLKGMEKDLIDRMQLHEVLKDDRLASELTPSMPLIEQLLREKAHIDGNALKNAKRLIQNFVSELAEVLRLEVHAAPSSTVDKSVPPRKVFRNLDLKRTLWRNLPNYDPRQQQLYVDRLYYQQTSRKKLPTRLIVVVDQSGSMVDAMVQCTILASIFAGLPNVDVHLIAFDTSIIDLTDWVHDPFEVLMRTQLGGGTQINNALLFASDKIQEPKHTALVLITDFYEGGSDDILLETIKGLIQSGVQFFPVGAVTSSGYFSVNQWFRTKLKELGKPILTGSPRKLIRDLKQLINS